jgi:hypothetical protein
VVVVTCGGGDVEGGGGRVGGGGLGRGLGGGGGSVPGGGGLRGAVGSGRMASGAAIFKRRQRVLRSWAECGEGKAAEVSAPRGREGGSQWTKSPSGKKKNCAPIFIANFPKCRPRGGGMGEVEGVGP